MSTGTQGDRAVGLGGPAAPPPACANHPVVDADWRCTVCDTPLCRECVHVFGRPPEQYASCRKCSERCEPLIAGPSPEEFRGGAESPEEARRRYLRDHVAPRATLGVAAVIQLVAATATAGFVAAIFTLPIWTALGAALYGLVLYKLEIEVEDLRILAWKAAAIALPVHAVRLAAIAILDLQLPEGGDTGSAGLAMIGMLAPLALCFVFIPLALIASLVCWLFDVELTESVYAIVGLMVAESFLFLLLKMGGMPG